MFLHHHQSNSLDRETLLAVKNPQLCYSNENLIEFISLSLFSREALSDFTYIYTQLSTIFNKKLIILRRSKIGRASLIKEDLMWIKVWTKNMRCIQKLAISKKSTIFVLFSWNFVKMITTWDDYFHQVSWWQDKNVDFLLMANFLTCLLFISSNFTFLEQRKLLMLMTIFAVLLLDEEPCILICICFYYQPKNTWFTTRWCEKIFLDCKLFDLFLFHCVNKWWSTYYNLEVWQFWYISPIKAIYIRNW